jgi:lactate permease
MTIPLFETTIPYCIAIFVGPPGSSTWMQAYDPSHHWLLSTAWAALPLIVLLAAMIVLRLKGHISALVALAVALIVAVGIYHMPTHLAFLSTVLGAGYGLFPIFWIVFPVIFMYQLTVRAGRFGLLQECLVGVTEDSRLQLLLIAFIFGAFFEGAAGFGTPVAVCGTILLGLGFLPLEAAGLALLANTAPVAFGALGTPVIALHGVTGLDTLVLTSVVATLLTPFCILVPFWLIWAFAGFKAMCEVWPAILVSPVSASRNFWSLGSTALGWSISPPPSSACVSSSCFSACGNRNEFSTRSVRTSPTFRARCGKIMQPL